MGWGSSGDGFGALVRTHRTAAGLTQEELAEVTGLSVRAISDLERGRTSRPRRGSVELLRRALGLQADDAGQQVGRSGQAARSEQPFRRAPRQLPAAVGHFIGREAELRTLTDRVLDTEGAEHSTVLTVISGTPGVGKTALVVRWAHEIAGRFPDGQLYVNLRGYDAREPVTAADALAGFLRALGVSGQDIPPTEEERAAAFRTMVADCRILLLLDNAASTEHVRPLLPGDPACMTVVTSRDSLAGLVARHGAERIRLDGLTAAESASLLRALIGDRVDAEPAAAARLAARCCGLPLALRVAAELAASRPGITLADLAAELADEQSRLDLLDAGADPGTSVRAVFSWSYQHLPSDAARVFRLIALHPGPDIDGYSAAAITGLAADRSRQIMNRLVHAHLLQPARADRYLLHDLVRVFARELTATDDPTGEREAAIARLTDYYLATAGAAMDALYPAERHRRPALAASASPVPPVRRNPAAARTWMDQERAALVAITRTAMDHGMHSHVALLSATLFHYLHMGGHHQEALAIHRCACQAAARTGDPVTEAEALLCLGLTETWQGRHQEAAGLLESALRLCERAGHGRGQARALQFLGMNSIQRGYYEEAAGALTRALALYRDEGDRIGESRALENLAIIDGRLGRYQQAIDRYQQLLALSRLTGDRNGQASQLAALAGVYHDHGQHAEAISALDRALALFRQIGDQLGEAQVLAESCQLALTQGNETLAADLGRQAMRLFRAIGDRASQADSLNARGDILLAIRQPDNACAEYRAALHAATAAGDKFEQAHASYGLARGYRAAGMPDHAGQHLEAALSLYTDLRAPQAQQILRQAVGADAHSLT